MKEYIICEVCKKRLRKMMPNHLKLHGIESLEEYKKLYPDSETCCQEIKDAIKNGNKIQIENPKVSSGVSVIKEHGLRKNKRISYEEFLEYINSGLSIVDIIKMGVSKHQLHAFSALSQNRIGITREQFAKEQKNGTRLEDISKKYGVPREYITALRQHWGFTQLPGHYYKRIENEKPISVRQEKIIYGSLMGDASKSAPRAVKFKQSDKQKDYLYWKYNELKEHITETGVKKNEDFDKRYNKIYTSYSIHTNSHTKIGIINEQFYSTGRKSPTREIMDQLDELSVAVWFMDDGTTGFQGKLHYLNAKPDCYFCTDSFTVDECSMICTWFKEKYNIESFIKIEAIEKPRIKFNTIATAQLHEMISPYVIDSMRYKIDFDAYVEYRKLKNNLPEWYKE